MQTDQPRKAQKEQNPNTPPPPTKHKGAENAKKTKGTQTTNPKQQGTQHRNQALAHSSTLLSSQKTDTHHQNPPTKQIPTGRFV